MFVFLFPGADTHLLLLSRPSGNPDEADSHRSLQRDHQDLRGAVPHAGALQQGLHRAFPPRRQRQGDRADHDELREAQVSARRDPRQQGAAGAGSEDASHGQPRDGQKDEQPEARPHTAPQDQGPVSSVSIENTIITQTPQSVMWSC